MTAQQSSRSSACRWVGGSAQHTCMQPRFAAMAFQDPRIVHRSHALTAGTQPPCPPHTCASQPAQTHCCTQQFNQLVDTLSTFAVASEANSLQLAYPGAEGELVLE